MYCKHKPPSKEIALPNKRESLCLVCCVMVPVNPRALPAGEGRGGRQGALWKCLCREWSLG